MNLSNEGVHSEREDQMESDSDDEEGDSELENYSAEEEQTLEALEVYEMTTIIFGDDCE